MSAGQFTALEWGTSRIVARLIDDGGNVVVCQENAVRLADLDRTGMSDLLARTCTNFPVKRNPAEPVWLAGMIGSALGWTEAGRVSCPATPEMVLQGLRHHWIGDIPVLIVPGLGCVSRFGDLDMMRGEEIVALGALALHPDQRVLLLSASGMHGKWMELRDGAIQSFHTAMTVELATIVSEHSILAGHINEPPVDDGAFRDGVLRGLDGGGLSRLIFSVRTAIIGGRIASAQAASHLWGLLIGAEIRELNVADHDCVLLGGIDTIVALYTSALSLCGVRAALLDRDSAAQGFARLRAQYGRQVANT
jgi:2-dehydro-3-deoxygalactonokinase